MASAPMSNESASPRKFTLRVKMDATVLLTFRDEFAQIKKLGACINISDEPTSERIVNVTGNADVLFKAFTIITKKQEIGDSYRQDLFKLHFVIPASRCGYVIKSGGSEIKNQENLAGVTIAVRPIHLDSTKKVVCVTGSLTTVSKCFIQLFSILFEFPPGSEKKDSLVQTTHTEEAEAESEVDTDQSDLTDTESVCSTISLPSDLDDFVTNLGEEYYERSKDFKCIFCDKNVGGKWIYDIFENRVFLHLQGAALVNESFFHFRCHRGQLFDGEKADFSSDVDDDECDGKNGIQTERAHEKVLY